MSYILGLIVPNSVKIVTDFHSLCKQKPLFLDGEDKGQIVIVEGLPLYFCRGYRESFIFNSDPKGRFRGLQYSSPKLWYVSNNQDTRNPDLFLKQSFLNLELAVISALIKYNKN